MSIVRTTYTKFLIWIYFRFEDASTSTAVSAQSSSNTSELESFDDLTVTKIVLDIGSTQTSQTPGPASTSASPGRHGVSTGVIAGSAVGAAVIILVLVGAIIFCVKRRRRPDEDRAYETNRSAPARDLVLPLMGQVPNANAMAATVPEDGSPPLYMPTDPHPSTSSRVDEDINHSGSTWPNTGPRYEANSGGKARRFIAHNTEPSVSESSG